jgi:hypothetical protein
MSDDMFGSTDKALCDVYNALEILLVAALWEGTKGENTGKLVLALKLALHLTKQVMTDLDIWDMAIALEYIQP